MKLSQVPVTRRKRRMILAGALSVLTLLAGSIIPVSASTLLYTSPFFTQSVRTDGDGTTVGFEFTVSTNIAVTALGVWDQGADGLNAAHDIGLWTASGTLLAHATVGAGTSGTLVMDPTDADGFRFTTSLLDAGNSPIRYVNLASGGTYRLGDLLAGGDPFKNNTSTATFATGTTDTGSYFGGGAGLGFPSADGGPGGFFGPNLEFDAAMTPEPSTVLLLGLGGLLLWRKQRRKHGLA